MRAPIQLCVLLALPACVGHAAPELSSEAQDASAPDEPIADASRAPARDDDEPALAPTPADAADGAQDTASEPPAADVGVQFGRSERFDGYLMDRLQQPLYMFVDDVAGLPQSACLDACALAWPPFDAAASEPGPAIIANEITRFHRQDGKWQSAYKGHPLYYRASEKGAREITGDGQEGRWFVARDYLAFMAATTSFSPAGSTSFKGMFLTNGFGRTLYVCLDDTPASATAASVSSCVGDCARRRPLWSASEAARTSVLPSVLDPAELGELQRDDGAVQLIYRGWPLYYFSGDQSFGDTQGENQDAWRAIDPVNFAVDGGAG
jgi:predicted lipoprotein with Yx(FWY)xxD motif